MRRFLDKVYDMVSCNESNTYDFIKWIALLQPRPINFVLRSTTSDFLHWILLACFKHSFFTQLLQFFISMISFLIFAEYSLSQCVTKSYSLPFAMFKRRGFSQTDVKRAVFDHVGRLVKTHSFAEIKYNKSSPRAGRMMEKITIRQI